jgi:membrane-associated phospholipid phosphatase
LSQCRWTRVVSCLVVAVLFPLTARAGEQASTTSENDSPVVVTPANAGSTTSLADPTVTRSDQAPVTGGNDGPVVLVPPADPEASSVPATPTVTTPSAPLPLEAELGGDGRRTLGRFGANLGRNIIGVFSKDNLGPLLIGAAVAGAGSSFDTHTERFFAAQDRFATQGSVGQQIGGGSVIAPLTLSLFVLGRMTPDSRFRSTTYDITQAFLVNAVYTGALKHITGRVRPDGSDDFSFPSGHTSNAVAWATVLEHHYGPRLGVPAYMAAGLIGVSRLEKNAHHLSDVLAGATLGYVVGRTVVREDGEPVKGRRFVIAPATAPDGSGIGASVSVQF